VQARAKGGSHAPIAFGDFRWQRNPTTKAKSSPGHSNSYVTFPWVVRDQIKEGQPAPLALGVAFGGWSWGDAYPASMVRAWGALGCAREIVGRVARTGLPQFSPSPQCPSRYKPCVDGSGMVALASTKSPTSVRVPRCLYEELRNER